MVVKRLEMGSWMSLNIFPMSLNLSDFNNDFFLTLTFGKVTNFETELGKY